MICHYYQKEKGFTLLETIVAIFVLCFGVVAFYSLVPKILQNQQINYQFFLASQLAQEGMELVRNIRDNNWLQESADWKIGLTTCTNGCEIDYNDSILVSYQNRFLKLDTNGFYNYENGTQSKFKRKITITDEGNNTLKIKTEVFWDGKGSPFVLASKLYNWR